MQHSPEVVLRRVLGVERHTRAVVHSLAGVEVVARTAAAVAAHHIVEGDTDPVGVLHTTIVAGADIHPVEVDMGYVKGRRMAVAGGVDIHPVAAGRGYLMARHHVAVAVEEGTLAGRILADWAVLEVDILEVDIPGEDIGREEAARSLLQPGQYAMTWMRI